MIVEKAKKNAKKVVENAEIEAEEIYKTTIEKAKEEASSKRQEALQKGKEDSTPIVETAKKEAEKIKNVDEGSLEKVVKSIVEKVVIEWQ